MSASTSYDWKWRSSCRPACTMRHTSFTKTSNCSTRRPRRFAIVADDCYGGTGTVSGAEVPCRAIARRAGSAASTIEAETTFRQTGNVICRLRKCGLVALAVLRLRILRVHYFSTRQLQRPIRPHAPGATSLCAVCSCLFAAFVAIAISRRIHFERALTSRSTFAPDFACHRADRKTEYLGVIPPRRSPCLRS